VAKTNRLSKLNPKRVAGERITLERLDGRNRIFFLVKINKSIAASRLKCNAIQVSELQEFICQIGLFYTVR
jgi:hypothetical protein